jgi:hypothetical protein
VNRCIGFIAVMVLAAENESMNYSIRSTEKAEGKALSALVAECERTTVDSAKKKEIPASILVLQQPGTKIHHLC